MRARVCIAISAVLLASTAAAATSGRLIAEQIAKPNMQQEAARSELLLTQAVAYPRSWAGDESRWAIFAAPAEVDLSGLRASLDPDAWVSSYVQRDDALGLRLTVDPDGDAVEMYLHDHARKLRLGASGTMGHVDAPRIEGDRLRGHYVHFGDLFGSSLVVDLQIDAERWQAPKAIALPPGGGAAGAAYLAFSRAVHAGDRAGILAAQPKDRPAPDEAEFARALPRLQAMVPRQPQVAGGELYGETAVLKVADSGSAEPVRVEMRREGERWVMVRTQSGGSRGSDLPAPPAFAETSPDLCATVLQPGVVCGDLRWKEAALAIHQVLGVHSGETQHLVLLAPGKLDPAHAAALWDSEAPLEPLFGNGPARGLLLEFAGAQGLLSASTAYDIDPDAGFNEDSALRGEAVRIGDRIYGSLSITQTNPDTGDSTVLQVLRFEAPVHDQR